MNTSTAKQVLVLLVALAMVTSPIAGTVGAATPDAPTRDVSNDAVIEQSSEAAGATDTAGGSAGATELLDDSGVQQALQEPGFEKETVLDGLSQPTAMTFLPDGRMLLLQKGGEVLLVNPETGASSTYMTISDLDTAGEEGLIDVTLDPNFEQNGYVYIYYTPSSSGKNRIARFTHQENDGGLTSSADPSSEFVVWEDNNERKSNYHHGGGLDFGPDGKLYLTIGEEVDGPQAQDLTQAGGSVIRVNKDGTIPQDNPFVDGDGGNVDAIWAYGLRNPFRAEWDLQSDNPRYYIAEVGGNQQSTAQEDIHLGEKGANYGWPDCEGECDNPDYTDAFYTYPHEGSGASITGGVVYHGTQFPSEYQGAYFFADYVRGWMKYMTFDGNGNVSDVTMFDDSAGAVVEIDEGPDGSLYYLDIATGTLEEISYDSTTDAEPTLDAPSTVFVDEGESKQVTVTASDADGDALTLSASNLPGFASFTDNGDGTGTLSLSPVSGDAGQYQAAVSVSDGDDTTSETVTISALEPGAAQVVHRLHAGSGTISAVDDGPDWESDAQYMTTGGDTSDWSETTYSVGPSVPASTPDAVFETERWPTSGSTIDYDLPVTQGETYEVRLYFIEQYSATQNPGDRVFDVTIDGETVLDDYDVVADVGYKNATMKSFEVTADDATLDLAFSQDGGSANPFMYGIEVVKPGDSDSNQAPSASFTASTTDATTGESIDFDASGASDPDGSIQSYAWDLDGDDQTDATGQQVSHTFQNAGTYQVTLTVTDDQGATATTTQSVTVSEPQSQQVLYRVNAAGSEISVADGPDWTADNNSAPSQYLETPSDVTVHDQQFDVTGSVPTDTPDQIFVTERWPQSSGTPLEYTFPVTQGETYEVRLYFIEQWDDYNSEGTRIFDVNLEGQTVLNDYDIMADVGFDNATMKSFEVTADDATLDLSLAQDGGSAKPFVYGIEVIEPGDETNQPPTATISSPADGTIFQAGDTISFAGSATDPEDGALDGTQLEWTVQFLHNEHYHPALGPQSGSSGTFDVPVSGHDFHDDTAYKIVLEATDSDGATDTTSVVVEPDKVNLTFDTQPSGLELKLDGIPYTTPHVHDTLVDFQHTVTAPQTQCVDGTQYEFDGWSDGGAAEHTVTVPDSDTTYTATYTETGQCGTGTQTIAEAVASQNAPTDQIGQTEIQVAINWWATESTVPGTDGATISQQQIQQLINMWATEATVGDGDQNQPPTADFHVHDPVAGQSATYHAEASDTDGQITQYEWDFNNDGTFEESTTNAQIQHTFASAGDYQVTLKVTDDDGATDTVTKTVSVGEQQSQQIVYRVSAGGPAIEAQDGPDWTADNESSPSQYRLGGDGDGTTDWESFTSNPPLEYDVGSAVPASTPDIIFEYERYASDGSVDWAFPVTQGETYEVRLYYIEQYSDAQDPGDRVFDVTAEGQTVLNDYDVVADVGYKNATMKTFEVTADDATLDLSIAQDGGNHNPNVFGIEILTESDGATNQQPDAAFDVSPTDPTVSETVDFDASGSSDADGSITNFAWDLDGDNQTDATGQQVSHTFQSTGTHQVTLTVTDDQGATATTTQSVTVSEQQTQQVLYRVNAGDSAVSAIDGGQTWESDSEYLTVSADQSTLADWTDDPPYTVGSAVPESTPDGIFESERYPTGGNTLDYDLPVTQGETYEVRLYFIEQWSQAQNPGDRIMDVSLEGETVLNDYDVVADVGFRNATMKSFTVTADDGTLDLSITGATGTPLLFGMEVLEPGDGGANQAPSASISASSSDVETGESINFDASASSDSDGTIQSYEWDFGDGETATGPTATHTYDAAGDYQVTLTVTDDQGATASATETVSVSEQQTEQVVYRVNAGGPELQATDGGPNWAVDNLSSQSPYLVGDGQVTVHDEQFNVTESVPSSTPDQLFVTERYVGQQMSWDFPVTAGDTYEVRLYYIEQWQPNAQEGVRIFDVDIDGTTVQNDYDIMADVGFDNATMKSFTVTADDGTLDVDFAQDGGSAYPLIYGIEIVKPSGGDGNQAPSASIGASATDVETGQSVDFDASGASDPDGSIQSYAWDLDGDDQTDATGAQVSHTFQSTGTYQVTVTVTDDDGATATATETVSVSAPATGTFSTEQVLGGLQEPVAMETLPDGRILLVERGGDVVIAEEQGGSLETADYLSVPNVSTNGEQGLLGATIDPNFEQNGYVYLYYSNENTNRNQISRFVHQENGGGLQSTADPASETKLWNSSIQGDATYHHGGGLDVGPDGKLYLTTGEQYTATRAQDLSSTGGKIIRINKDGTIPSDNPYVDDGDPDTRGDVWASGLRNPFRAEWDHQTDRFFVAEVGLDTAEDIHLGEKGANYGWPNCEGECSDPAYSDPVFTYGHDVGGSITGGDFYRGSQFPSEYEGAYFYGDYVAGWIKYLTFDGSGDVTGSHDFASDVGPVVEIDQGPGGSLYYITIDGSVHRISYQPAAEGSASISLNEGNSNIDTSTWKTGAVEIDNTGDKQIESVTFDLSTAAMPDIVFGPLTDSGTPGNAVKDASGAGGFQATYSQPHDGNPDDGYDKLTLTFDNFEPGETFTASLDTDATSIKGATPIQQGLEISGLETTGTSITIEYADGTTQTTTPFSDGSAAGAVATAKSDVPAAPSLDVQGVTLNSSALDTRHSAATVSSAQKTIELSGEPGSTVRVLRFEGELNLEGVSGYDIEPYEANRILNFDEQTVTLDSNGAATVDVTLTNSSANGGLNYLVAVAEDEQGDTGLTSDPVVLEYDQDAAQPSDGEVTVAITTTEAAFPDGKITLQDATTYFEDSVLITNTGDKQIESLTIDKSTALISSMVFDPTGCAGDGGCNPGSTSLRIVNDGGAGLTSHQFLKSVNGVDGTDGYKALQFNFSDFDPGETFSYASDGDPNTIKGGGGQQSVLAGPESGIDLTGSTVTVTFADGTTASADTFNEGSLAGSTGVARASAPAAPTVDVQDVSLQPTTLSDRHSAATVADADQTIEITGPPGETVRLMHAEATLLLEDVPDSDGDGMPGYDIEPYEANNVENYTITDVQLGQDGTATVDVTLTNLTNELTSPADKSGFNYFVATVQGDDGHAGTTSNVAVLKLEEGSDVPSIESVSDQFLTEGDSTTVTVAASDPNGDALTLSASNLPGFASFTDNGDGTGTLTLAPQSGDAGSYDITLSASDGDDTTTQQVSVSVTAPGAEQVVHRLHAGSGTISAVDDGPDWESDAQYMTTGGDTSDWSETTYSVGASVPASTPDAVFETERWPTSGSTIDYDLPVTQGETYEVRLYYIEQYDQTQNPGDRVFDVTIDGQTVLNDYDVVADVGFKNATMESFTVTADDGTLDLTYSQDGGSANPFMYGIEVVKPSDGDTNQAPSASFTASATDVETGQSVDFDASGASDPDGSIQSYAWDLDGDNQTDATGQQVSHTFQSTGTHQVTLTVTDDQGATATTTQSVTVSEPPASQVLYRVNTGGSEVRVADGLNWTVDDQYVQTSVDVTEHDQQFNVTGSVPAGTPDQIFVTERWPASGSTLDYDFPVTQGETYEVRLYFVEQWGPNAQEDTRIFDVTAEGQTVLNDYDIMADVGFDNATMKSFTVTADDATLDLSLVKDGGSANPFVYGIEIIEKEN